MYMKEFGIEFRWEKQPKYQISKYIHIIKGENDGAN